MRRWHVAVLLLVVAFVAGCSSPYKLVIHNDTVSQLRAVVEWDDRGQHRSVDYDVAPEESELGLVWFGDPPDEFTVKVTSEPVRAMTFRRGDFPAELLGSTSMGPVVHLRIGNGTWQLSGQTFWDRFERSIPNYILGLACCGFPALTAIILLVRWRRSRVSLPATGD